MSARVPLVGGLIAVLLGLAFFFLLYQPRVEEQAALEQETLALESQQATLVQQIARLERIRDEQPTIEAALARLEELIPSDAAQPAALRQFQVAADAAGLEITSVSFSDPLPAEPVVPVGDDEQLGVIATSITLEGGYFQQVDFLRRLEQDSARAVLVESVAAAEGEAFPSLSTTVNADLFALIPAEADPATTPAPTPPAPTPPDAGQEAAT